MPPRLEGPTIFQSRSLLRWRSSDARRGILARERHPPAEKAGLDATDRFGSARRPDGVLWHVEGLLLLLVRKRRYGRRCPPRHYPAEAERRCARRFRLDRRQEPRVRPPLLDRKSTRLNSSP